MEHPGISDLDEAVKKFHSRGIRSSCKVSRVSEKKSVRFASNTDENPDDDSKRREVVSLTDSPQTQPDKTEALSTNNVASEPDPVKSLNLHDFKNEYSRCPVRYKRKGSEKFYESSLFAKYQ